MEKGSTKIYGPLVTVLTLFILFIIIEISFRIFGPEYYKFNNVSHEYFSNPRGYFDVVRVEGTDTIYGLDYLHTDNSYRMPPKMSLNGHNQQPKEKPVYAIGLGDSFTYGCGVRYKDIYLTKLEKLLNEDNGNRNAKIKNCGVTAWDLEHIYQTYLEESTEISGKHLVIYGFVLNDFGLITQTEIVGLDFIDLNNGEYKYSKWRKVSALVNSVCYIIDQRRLNTVTTEAYLECFRGENAEMYFGILGQLNERIVENNGVLLLVVFPLLYNFDNYQFMEIHNKMKNFCSSNNILYLDLLPAFSKYKAEELWAHPTDHHPNEIAHQIAAEEIYDFLTANDVLALVETR
ncbi:hypothetical protein JXI42_14410 [bacterium]|nr:hypothetical protein [bacterium]